MSSSSIASATVASPIEKKDRILFLDAIRGFALLGILLMNITAQGQPFLLYTYLNLDQSIVGKNYIAWVVEMMFFEGTMRGLFSILFGAGTLLLMKRLEKTRGHIDAADIYYRRILWLLFFGLINAFIFLWTGDILYPYALCGLVLFPFRNTSPKKLWVWALVLLAFGTYRETQLLYDKKDVIAKGRQVELLEKANQKLTETQVEDKKKWETFQAKNSSEGLMKAVREEVKEIQTGGYTDIFAYYREVNVEFQSVFFYNSWWDVLGLFFIGIALMRTGFLEGKKSNVLYAAIAFFGILLSLAYNYIGIQEMYKARFDVVKMTENMPAELYQVRRLLQTMGYLSLIILLYKIVPFRKAFNLLVPVGQMAFSNYLMQSIITSILFLGFGYFGKFERHELYEIVIVIWVFQILFSHIWLKYFLFGPFEWLWRSLTYKKLQPFLK